MTRTTKFCAIYTRKSTDERLEMEFNSLDAQREACLAYIASQKAEGWQPIKKLYDDGGFSGGNIARPALAELLTDIKAGKVHTVVVYKIDRLTRSLTDFVKLVEVFDRHGVTFVSVTQSFNTTTSMGRLTLNVLLSFAQFEREVAGERIRDKIAASKKKGMFMGGVPPIGYKVKNRQLVVDTENAKITKHIFERYLAFGSTIELANELKAQGIKSPNRISEKGIKYEGAVFSRGALQQILTNPMYIGKLRHKNIVYDGQHQGIIPVEIWNKVQGRLKSQAVSARGSKKSADLNLLRKLLFDAEGYPYKPTFANKNSKRYRYYVCEGRDVSPKLPAHEIETTAEQSIRGCLISPKKAAEMLGLHEEYDCYLLNKIAEDCPCIPVHELLSETVKKVTVSSTKVIISLDIAALRKLLSRHIKTDFPDYEFRSTHDIDVPYVRARASKGAIVIQPEGNKKNILDLPPDRLKKLVQGIIWRNEHHAGRAVKEIAIREACSESYVGTAITGSFEILQSAFPASAR
jgi:DNA invertase Pin-like site-specific DNA recombinase